MKAWKGSAEDVPGGTPLSTSSKTGGKNYEKTAQHSLLVPCTATGLFARARLRLRARRREARAPGSGAAAAPDGKKTDLLLWLPPFAAGDDGALDKEFWTETLAPWAAENNVDLTIEITPWGNYEEKYLTGFSSGEGRTWAICIWRCSTILLRWALWSPWTPT